MTHTEIECFLAICRHKTASRAAESLFITQPSLSIRLKTLENELGGSLFVRKKGSREMVLTAAGKEFYELATQYEALVQQMLQVCHKQPESLRVSSLNSLDTFLLPDVYERFLQNYPEIGLEIQDMEMEAASQSIRNGTTDLAFTTGTLDDKQIAQTLAFVEPMVLICGINAPYNEQVSPEQLSLRHEVYVEWSNRFARWHQQTFGDLHPQISISIMAHLQQFMDREHCWAIVPVSVAAGLVARRCEIRQLKTTFPLPQREVSILTDSSAKSNAAIEAFYRCLRETVAVYPEIQITL